MDFVHFLAERAWTKKLLKPYKPKKNDYQTLKVSQPSLSKKLGEEELKFFGNPNFGFKSFNSIQLIQIDF